MYDSKKLKEQLKGYHIEGDIGELINLITSNSQVSIHLRDIIQALSDSCINYVRTGYGETLDEAYKEAAAKGNTCKLVHVLAPVGEIMPQDLYSFIMGIGDDVIWGYLSECMNGSKMKLVMIFN